MDRETQSIRPRAAALARPTRRGLAALTVAGLTIVFRDRGSAAAQGGARAPWQAQVEPMETVDIMVGERTLTVELAASPETRARGLGYRQGLAPGTGMLFVFPEAAQRSFWMKGMRFCLDIIWINDGAIVGAAESVCPEPQGTPDTDRQSYPSGEEARFVLEVPAGWLAEHGLGPGTPVVIPARVTTAN